MRQRRTCGPRGAVVTPAVLVHAMLQSEATSGDAQRCRNPTCAAEAMIRDG